MMLLGIEVLPQILAKDNVHEPAVVLWHIFVLITYLFLRRELNESGDKGGLFSHIN